jgi:hypothetical protein
MTENKFGEQGWDDVKVSGGEKEKVDFMRLKEGSNVVRVITLPHQYYQHRWEPAGGRKYGYKIQCSDPTNHKDCPMCEQGNKATRKWFLGVIDRASGQYKVLDTPWTVFKGMQLLARDEDWGPSLENFDIDIVNNPSAGAQRYSTIAKPKKPLSAADLQIKEERGTKELVRRSTPPEREVVQGFYDHILEELKEAGTPFEGSASDSGKASDEEEDTFFKDYDKK